MQSLIVKSGESFILHIGEQEGINVAANMSRSELAELGEQINAALIGGFQHEHAAVVTVAGWRIPRSLYDTIYGTLSDDEANAQVGVRIQCIKQVRDTAGLGLAESKAVVDEIAKRAIHRTGHAATSLPPLVYAEAKELVYHGRKLEAIKRIREVTSLGLKEAKDLVDSM